MSTVLTRDVQFGWRWPGRATLGCTLLDPATGATLQARRELAVVESAAEPGYYTGLVEIPAAAGAVTIAWDVPGTDPAVTARETLDLSPSVLGPAPPAGLPAETSLREGLVAYLRGSAELMALVGGRLRPGPTLPQGEPVPALTYEVLADRKTRQLSGSTRYREARLQVGCWGRSVAQCVGLADAVDALLESLTAGGFDADLGGVVVRTVRHDAEEEEQLPLQDAGDSKRWIFPALYVISYKES